MFDTEKSYLGTKFSLMVTNGFTTRIQNKEILKRLQSKLNQPKKNVL